MNDTNGSSNSSKETKQNTFSTIKIKIDLIMLILPCHFSEDNFFRES